MSDEELRKLAAIMFTDMVGYSALSQRDGKLALELLEEHRRLLREIFPRFNGTEIKTIGDAFLIEFNSALEAAQCAIEIQRALAKRNADVPPDRRIEVKIGIHIGDVVHRGGDVYGDGVNIASRIEPLAGAGGICISMDVERQIRNAVETRLEKLAPTELKNISVAMDLFRIVLPWERPSATAAISEIRSQRQSGSDESETTRGPRWPWAAAAIILLLIIGIGWWWTTLPHKNPASPQVEGGAPATPNPDGLAGARPSIPEKSIAVLPFDNLSDDKSNAYFAEGIQDEILTKLASIADLKVISRTSTAKYESKPEDLKTVSQQLGVAKILEGTVQRAGEKVRVNVQLIDARADSHLWAKSYDRDIKDVFAVESEVSQEVADALQAKLSPNEANSLAAAPTKDAEAYDLFLKGEYEEREAEGSLRAESFDRAAVFYQQALDHDPKFALAAARLVESRMNRHWFVTRLSETELAKVKSLAEHALALGPNLAAAHLALGNFYYLGYRQYDQALQEFQRALDLQPNNLRALEFSAYVHRRQGDWPRALSALTKCLERDPRDASLVANTGAVYTNLRMWSEGKRLGLRALALDPHNILGMRQVVTCDVSGTGDVADAKRALATFPPDLRLVNKVVIGNASAVIGEGTYLHVLEHDFSGALKDWEKETADPDESRMRPAARAAIHVLAGDAAGAQPEIEKARALLEARLHEQPQDGSAMMQLAWVNLALGHKVEALHLAHQASESLPIEKDAIGGPYFLSGLAEIEAQTGETNEAIGNLRQLLSIRAGLFVSIQRLRIDPVWDPIRNDPGFQQLLAGKELVGPNE
jgi:TolB-like protein/class 3 adenylate cyclase/Tfp pilus assembly protein PilF